MALFGGLGTMGTMGTMGAAAAPVSTAGLNVNSDSEVMQQPPTDGVSGLAWSPAGNFFAASSWDRQMRVWEVQQSGAVFRAASAAEQPVLGCCWADDGTRVFSGGCDHRARMWTLQTNQAAVVAQHDAPIRACFYVSAHGVLGTASWDKTVRYWDIRTAPTGAAAYTVALGDKIWAAHGVGNVLVAATADNNVSVYDLRNPTTLFGRVPTTLRHQTRCVTVFQDQSGFAVASIEGRCSIQYFNDTQNRNFAFKCHRQETQVYAVNDISFHAAFPGTFSTVGSDGVINFWDKDNRHRLKAFNRCPCPITCGKFNRDGTIFAYSVSYDWSKGIEGLRQCPANAIFLHAVQADEVRPKPKDPTARPGAAPARAPTTAFRR